MSLYLGENLISGMQTTVDKSERVGQIIASTIPLTDAGLHLLDGALISGGGIYDDFVTYMATLSGTNPECFDTEANWQTAVTTYGVCGKFVYDSVNNTVRLPKITGFVEGASGTATLGDLTEAGLPNITGTIVAKYGGATSVSGAFTNLRTPTSQSSGGSSFPSTYDFDASQSNSIYGNSSTVQPQAIKVLYYIVVATSTKTDIQVDIDEIATDLNGKADVDLSNCTRPYIVEMFQDGESGYIIYSNKLCEEWGHNTSGSSIGFYNTFANTNYNITMVEGGGGAIGTNSNNQVIQTVSTTGFTFNAQRGNFYWRVIGYIS